MTTERFIVLNEPDEEAEYLAYDNEQLSGFAEDVAFELAYHLVKDTEVRRVEVTLRWDGEY